MSGRRDLKDNRMLLRLRALCGNGVTAFCDRVLFLWCIVFMDGNN